ncbi:hypothetical protein [Dactylosporangium sp. CA-233914]|uniref:hypothetical protein n=1 Tax=Dactylosporangium sp. CA-233914 TaxID=3239934 RepID=UPI003D8EA55D
MFGNGGRNTVQVSGDNVGIISMGASTTNNLTVLPREAMTPVAGIAAPGRTVNLPAFPRDLLGRDAESARLGGAPVQVVHGLGGVGKSALVARYAGDHLGRCNPVWWINAASRADVDLGLAGLAGALQPGLATAMHTGALAERAIAWLAAHSGWLLVLDDVRSRPDIAGLLNRLGAAGGRIVITSRFDLDWRQIAPSVIRLGPLSDAAAQQLLTRRRPAMNRDGATELCAALGNLPLALDLAAAFLERAPYSPRQYRSLLANGGGGTVKPIAAVWRATLDSLDDPLAGEILRIFAWYAEHIPFGLVGDATGDPLPAAEAIARLVAANLVALSDDRTTVTVNPLLQSVVRHSGAERARDLAVTCLSHALPRSQEPSAWPKWRDVLPHVNALAERVEPAHDTAELADLLNPAGLYLLAQGGEAGGMLRRARDAYRRTRGRDHADTLAAANNVALAHHAAGDLSTAIGLYEEVAAQAGRDRLDRAAVACANNLACAYEEAGRPGEVIRRLEHTRDRWIAAHGAGDHYSLILTTNLASAYRSNGEPARAATLLQHVPTGTGWSSATFDALLERAKAQLDSGDPAAAIALLEPALGDARRRMGRDHPVGLDAEHTLGAAYLAHGRANDGIRLLESVLARRTASLGPADRRTLDTWHMLGVALANTGSADRAIQVLQAAATSAAVHGRQDPDAARIRADLDELRRRRAR